MQTQPLKKKSKNRARNWRLAILIFFLTVVAVFLAYNYFKQPFLKKLQSEQTVLEVEPAEPAALVTVDKNELSLSDKVAQLVAVPLDLDNFAVATAAALTSDQTPLYFDWIKQHNPGFVVYFGQEIEPAVAIGASEKILASFSEQQYAPLLAVDHEGGSVQRLSGEGFTKLPSWRTLSQPSEGSAAAAINRPDRLKLFAQSAQELQAVGINVVFAPVLDLSVAPNPVLAGRTGVSREATLELARDYIELFSSQQIMPVIKHFPGIGSIKHDLHDQIEITTLAQDDTQIFADILDDYGNIGVMTAHVRLKDKLDGKACSLSSACLGQLAEYYPGALIFTDDLLMKSARFQAGTSEAKDLGETAIEAIEAGNHVLVFGQGVNLGKLTGVLLALEEEYRDSASFRRQVDLAVAKVLQLKQ